MKIKYKLFFMKKTLSLFMICIFFAIGCGRKENPLPQKINHLYSFQDVYVYLTPTGAITVMGRINGARINVQALELQLEGYDENCPTCPFVPMESFAIDPRDTWKGNIPQDFSFTVNPTKKFSSYRWRLIGYNMIAGLPDVYTPVLQIQGGADY